MNSNNTGIAYNPLPALRRFAVAITILNIAGHFFLGFEQSWAYPLAALATTYSLELLFEAIYAKVHKRTPRFQGSVGKLVDFLLPAHITGMATSMLLFSNENLYPIIFASTVAICTKVLFRVNINGKSRHFLNPSNTGIAITLILFAWVGIAPPYMFTENIYGAWDWIIPGILVSAGTFLNTKFTGRMPLILSWLAGFALQAFIRTSIFDLSLASALAPASGLAFLLFTFYMVSDPATTPGSKTGQVLFGLSVAASYGVLMSLHVVFGLFFALFAVCTIRGLWIAVTGALRPRPVYDMIPELKLSSSRLTYEK